MKVLELTSKDTYFNSLHFCQCLTDSQCLLGMLGNCQQTCSTYGQKRWWKKRSGFTSTYPLPNGCCGCELPVRHKRHREQSYKKNRSELLIQRYKQLKLSCERETKRYGRGKRKENECNGAENSESENCGKLKEMPLKLLCSLSHFIFWK